MVADKTPGVPEQNDSGVDINRDPGGDWFRVRPDGSLTPVRTESAEISGTGESVAHGTDRSAPGPAVEPVALVQGSFLIGDAGADPALTIEDVRVYERGLMFNLVCRTSSINPLKERFSLSFRAKPPSNHHAAIMLTRPGGDTVGNEQCSLPAPHDGGTFWMSAGTSYRAADAAGAEYFVSPLPPSGTYRLNVQYHHFGIDETLIFDLEVPRANPL